MFKLSIQFATLVELTAFVNKMGHDVIGGTITHDQPIATDTAPATTAPAKKGGSRGGKKTTTEVEVPAGQTAPSAPAMPFPAGPSSFAPGNTPAQQPVGPVPSAPIAQPHVAPSAPVMAQAPIAPAPVAQPVQVSPERQQWNDACKAVVDALQLHGAQKGLTEQQMAQILANSFAQAGCPMGSRISTISDAEIQKFYPVLHANVTAALQ